MTTDPKAPTARPARTVQFTKARFRAICSAGIARSVVGLPPAADAWTPGALRLGGRPRDTDQQAGRSAGRGHETPALPDAADASGLGRLSRPGGQDPLAPPRRPRAHSANGR